jgi:hypothetical protein
MTSLHISEGTLVTEKNIKNFIQKNSSKSDNSPENTGIGEGEKAVSISLLLSS